MFAELIPLPTPKTWEYTLTQVGVILTLVTSVSALVNNWRKSKLDIKKGSSSIKTEEEKLEIEKENSSASRSGKDFESSLSA